LQSYFDSPDLVFFANHQEIIAEIKNLAINATEQNPFWFHAGEFSDSLALSHVTGELGDYFACFAGLPHCYLELRTKSNNIGELLKQKSLPNVMTTFSLSPVSAAKEYDLKTPGTMARLKALQKLSQHSFPLGLHFDPIILAPEGLEQTLVEYTELLTSMKDAFDLTTIHYLSLGVIRFPEKFYRQVQQNYPHSTMHQRYPTDWVTTEEGQIKYRRTIRQKLLEQVKSLAIEAGIPADRIYYCME
jgi:spore photoproduct lyase